MEFKVNTGAIVSTAQKFTSVAGEFQSQLSAVTSEVNSLSGAWTGAASAQFDELISKWDRDAKILTDDLNQITSRLTSAARAYEETETAARNAFNG